MHPEIRQVGPGSCPICGMALEPLVAGEGSGRNPELADMSRRFWVGLALTIPVVVLEMGGHFLGLDRYIDRQTSNWLQLAFATPVVVWAGAPFFQRGLRSVALDAVKVDDKLRVRPGEKVPVDGRSSRVEGQSMSPWSPASPCRSTRLWEQK